VCVLVVYLYCTCWGCRALFSSVVLAMWTLLETTDALFYKSRNDVVCFLMISYTARTSCFPSCIVNNNNISHTTIHVLYLLFTGEGHVSRYFCGQRQARGCDRCVCFVLRVSVLFLYYCPFLVSVLIYAVIFWRSSAFVTSQSSFVACFCAVSSQHIAVFPSILLCALQNCVSISQCVLLL